MATDATFDVIVLGSGGAGAAATLAASAFGFRVCLIEKADVLGGGTADSLGTIWIPNNRLAAEIGLDDDLDTALTYARYVGGGLADPLTLETYVREASRVLDAFLELGVGLRLALGLPDYFYPSGPGSCADGRRMVEAVPIERRALGDWANGIRPSMQNVRGVAWSESVAWGGFARRRFWPQDALEDRRARDVLGCGEALIGQFLAAALKRGAEVRLSTETRRLLMRDKRVEGVELADGSKLVAGRGVVLAAGGYEGDDSLIRLHEGLPNWMNPFSPASTGDAMRLATEIGGATGRVAVNNSLFVGCEIPGTQEAFFSVGLRGLPFPGAIAVNERGQRFCDETQFQDVVMALKRYDRPVRGFANLPAFMIFDDEFRKRYPVANALPGAPAHPSIPRGETIQDLADAICVDPDGLEQTMSLFNKDARNGYDSAFGRGQQSFSRNNSGDADRAINPQLAPVETPPFYALPLKLGGICSAGLLTDKDARVIHVRGDPIPGLYACGSSAAPSFLGVGYQGGSSIGAGMVFAYLAMEHALQEAT